MEADYDLALVFTALDSEVADLTYSLERFLENVAGVSTDFKCVVVIQQTSSDSDLALPDHPAIQLFRTPPAGVSAARNAGLRAAVDRARRVMFVDCRTILSRAFCQAAFSVSACQSALWLGNVHWDRVPGATHVSTGRNSAHALIDVAYEGFLWRCIFQTPLLANCRFREDIGPGTKSRIQSGEDCLFMRDVIINNNLHRATFDEHAIVERLPRQHLAQKESRYAFGAGYRAGQLLRTRFTFLQRYRMTVRCAAFLAQSVRLRFSNDTLRQDVGRDRLAGFRHGLNLTCGQ